MGQSLAVFGFFALLMVINHVAGWQWALGILAVPVAYNVWHRITVGEWVE